MRTSIFVTALLLLTSCAIQSATFTLSEPGDSNRASDTFSRHQLFINEDRMLVYNGEEQLFVPEGKRVEVRVLRDQETTFTLEDI